LSGLASSTLYHYRVKSKDAASNLATSADFTFTTLDGVAPVISAVSASSITASGATIAWTTNETADSQVEYGPTTGYGTSTTVNPSLVTAHSQALSGLASSTLYHYRVKSKDAAGNLATSADFTFTTLDGVAPVISAVAASSITASGATIAWTTNENADSQAEFGPTTAYGSSTALDASLVLSHSRALTGLTAGASYHYRVKSRDASGNLAVSGDFSFTTAATLDPSLIAYLKMDEGTGATAADASAHGNAGTLMNGTGWASGRTGAGVTLDGVDDYVGIPHNAALNAFPLTVAAWFKTTTNSGVRGLVNKYVAGSFNGYQIYFVNGNLCAWYMKDGANYVYDGTNCTMSTPGYNDGRWHQAALVVDNAGGRLYVDGTQKASRAWTGLAGPVSTTQEIQVGHYPGSTYLAAVVDELRIYSRALSTQEIVNIYKSGPTHALALFNTTQGQASLIDSYSEPPPPEAYTTYTPGAPVQGQWVMGDWDGNGVTTPAVFGNNGAFYYTNDVGPTTNWVGLWFGLVGHPPVAGRFDAAVDHDCLGVVDSAPWPGYGTAFALYFTCDLTSSGNPTKVVQWLGAPLPDSSGFSGVHQFAAGDFDGDGVDSVAVRRGPYVAWTNVAPTTLGAEFSQAQYIGAPAAGYGNVLAGDWDGDGIASFGLFYPDGSFFRRDDLEWNSALYTVQHVGQPVGTPVTATSWWQF
jgi:hypothetical protein